MYIIVNSEWVAKYVLKQENVKSEELALIWKDQITIKLNFINFD